MKGPFVHLLFALLIGAALAFIKPIQPSQIYVAPADSIHSLDNEGVPADSTIHPARKCGFCMG